MKTIGLVIVFISVFFNSCSDVRIEDHIAGTWELKTYLRNGVEETSSINISDYQETYILYEIYLRKYVDGKQQLMEETGKFDINEDDMSIHISDVSSIADFSSQHSTLSSSIIQVETINETEFVYSFANGGDNHEFRFIRME